MRLAWLAGLSLVITCLGGSSDPVVVWFGQFKDRSGLGEEARHFIGALETVQVPYGPVAH